MQRVMRWNGSVAEYLKHFSGIKIERPKSCNHCGCNKFYRWGNYERNVIEEDVEHRVPVRRFCCAKCRRTISYLPEFCISRVQYAAAFVMRLLSWVLGGVGGGAQAPTPTPPNTHESLRRRAYAFRQRFVAKLNLWLVFLRETGYGGVSEAPERKIKEFFKALRSHWNHQELMSEFYEVTGRHFMAR
jgi:hypothetical protein